LGGTWGLKSRGGFLTGRKSFGPKMSKKNWSSMKTWERVPSEERTRVLKSGSDAKQHLVETKIQVLWKKRREVPCREEITRETAQTPRDGQTALRRVKY